jgi:hypothetical protein
MGQLVPRGAPLPRFAQGAEFPADPNASGFNDEDRSEYPGMIDDWLRRGMFVVRVGGSD